jgi:hypothetical protein
MATEVQAKERLVWLGLALLLLVLVLWDHLAPRRDVEEPGSGPGQTHVEARCGIAAGRNLSGKEIAITCGLDDAGIEAVIAKAIGGINLPELVSQLQKGEETLPPELAGLAIQLGLSSESLAELLKKTTVASPGETLTPQRLAESITRETPELVVNVISTVSPREAPGSSGRHAGQAPPVEAPPMEKSILRESRTLHVECGLGAGENIEFDTADIKCGPNKEDIDAIIERLVAQSDVSQLVKALRQGTLSDTRLIDSFEDQLGVSRSTMLQLLKQITDSKVPPEQAADRLASAVERHTHLTYRLGQLPDDDQASSHLRDLVSKMIAAGNYPVAETLMLQWSQLNQGRDELREARKALAELQAEQTTKQSISQESEKPDRPLAPQTATDETATGPQAPGDKATSVFVSQDQVEFEAPTKSPAGSGISFAWRGPVAPGDLIFIAKPDVADNSYPGSDQQRHRAALGSPAKLTTPAEPGEYEIRYFSYANGEPLLRSTLEVTPAQVALMAPEKVSAGSLVEFAWQGPDAPGDLIFIAKTDMAMNRYFLSDKQRHRSSAGSPASLVAPAEPGDYEIRYFSRNNATRLVGKPISVSAPEVSFSAPGEVNPGAHIRFAWQGPGAPGDLIFISKPDEPGNQYPLSDRRRHRTSEGAIAELVAPAKPGQYEIRYFSYANGKPLASHSLKVR